MVLVLCVAGAGVSGWKLTDPAMDTWSDFSTCLAIFVSFLVLMLNTLHLLTVHIMPAVAADKISRNVVIDK